MPNDERTAAWVMRALDRMADPPEGESSVVDRLGLVVAAAVDVLDVDSAGLMLIDERETLRTVGFTDPRAAELESAQLRIGEGPGLDTARLGHSVAVADLAVELAYARLWTELSSTGLRSVLSCPVSVAGDLVGNLNVARNRPCVWSEADIRGAEAYAKVVATTLDLSAGPFVSPLG